MNEVSDRLVGLLQSSANVRYKAFLSAAKESGEVWLLASGEGYATFDMDGVVHLIVFPFEEAAALFAKGDEPVAVEIGDFLDRCREARGDANFRFMIFPNGRDATLLSVDAVLLDLEDTLSK